MKKSIIKSTTLPNIIADVENLNNTELIERCTQLGGISVKARRMFIGLLPLVARREAYNIKKFSSVHHFAAMVGGVEYKLVDEVLRLDNQLEEFQKLRKVLYSGEIGWAKIRLVISMVTKEDQERWLGLLRTLSKPALEVYLRDSRKQEQEENSLFSNAIIETTCESEESISQSPSSPKSAIFEAESFPGKESESQNNNGDNQDSQPGSQPEPQQKTPMSGEQPSRKQQELYAKQEKFSCTINQWLGAQLRLFRRKLEKQEKKWVTWEDALAELLKRAT